MKTRKVDLFCPACGMTILQITGKERPIQDTRITCPACQHRTRIALLLTAHGDSYQIHLRHQDPKAKIDFYPPHLVKHPRTRPGARKAQPD